MDINWAPGMTIENMVRAVIEKALKFYNGNKTKTAQALDIAIRTLDNKLAKYEGKEPLPDEDPLPQTTTGVRVEPVKTSPPQYEVPMPKRKKV